MKLLEATPSITKLMEAWRESLSQVLTEAGMHELVVETFDAKDSAAKLTKISGKRHSFMVNAGGRLHGTLRLFTTEHEALQLGEVRVPKVAHSAEPKEAHRGAAELLRQAAVRVTEVWDPGAVELEIAPPPDNEECECVCGGVLIGAENFAPVTLIFGPSADFVETLRILEEGSLIASSAAVASVSQSSGPSSNLDLLFDVQLEATIRFGGRQLLLRDILALSPGSAISLDRQVGEPAELLVAGRLVARGEVVVVEGNFGLRITEVVSTKPSELLHA